MKRSLKFISILLVCLSFLNMPRAKAASEKGDIDADGKITTVDARKVLRFAAAAEKPTSAQKKLADINGDGKVTTADVRAVLELAADIGNFETEMLRAGFPVSYVEYLKDLHELYPEWEFEPFITNLDWETSVDEERTPHSQQLIENIVSASFMCSCSSCKGKIQESPNWVSASREAVAYYMDPRNFLTPEYIFQFESTAFNENHTIEGIETILRYTWMYNSKIVYLDGLGNEKTYTENGVAPKYSEVILKAARDSGVSAYYLASKIVQEVGSTSSANAGGASGKNAPYNGIYNYYNIGAYTGVADGLKWANAYMKTTRSVVMYKIASTLGAQVVTVPYETEVYYVGTSGGFYRVSAIVGGKKYTGYVLKSDISAKTTYGRPWNTPQKSIYYGAQHIQASFGEHQFTGYLQKFNVNPQSDTLYGHEYMANVRAAAFEATSKYKAYKAAGVLDARKVFSIPVFKNMPNADLTREDAYKQSKAAVSCSDYSSNSVTLSWSSIAGTEKYQVYKYDASKEGFVKIATTTDLTYTDSTLSAGEGAKYRVRGYYVNEEGNVVYSAYDTYAFSAAPKAPTGLAVSSVGDSAVELKWTAVAGAKYVVYRYDAISGAYNKIGTSSTNSYTDSAVKSGTAYKYKVRSYITVSGKNYYSDYSSAVSATTTGEAPKTTGKVSVTDGYLNVRKAASTDADAIAQLTDGHAVTILGETGDWYKITFTLNGTSYTGYAHSDYITIDGSSSGSGTGSGTAGDEKEKCPYTEPDATVREGDSGESVRWVQWYLYKLGYLSESDIDSKFGPTTLSAVKKFQTDKELDVDGLVGPASRTALKEAYGA